jgi:hypothetical protein
MARSLLSLTCRGRPGRGSVLSPANPPAEYRDRHLHTVAGRTASRRANSRTPSPSAPPRTMRARRAHCCGIVGHRIHCRSDCRSFCPTRSLLAVNGIRGGYHGAAYVTLINATGH